MRYVRIYADEHGRSAFADVEIEGTLTHVVDGVPPMLLSGPFGVSGLIFSEQPTDATGWTSHVAPRRQWIIVLQGRIAITVSSGETREFDPGQVFLAEDTEGEGHGATPLTPDCKFAMIPVMT